MELCHFCGMEVDVVYKDYYGNFLCRICLGNVEQEWNDGDDSNKDN